MRLEFEWPLGADRLGVIRLILRRGLGLAAIGLVAGVLLAGGAAQLLSALLFGVTPLDPATFGLALALLLAVAGVATVIPAWRASGTDPLVALRQD